MLEHLKTIASGGVVGVLVAGSIAIPDLLPPAYAQTEPTRTLLATSDELFPASFDASNLVKPDFDIEPSVSTEVLSTATVRKIGYGRIETVKIATTPTGTYSTDGLTSPHVRYPGIHVDSGGEGGGPIAEFSNGRWVLKQELAAGSFLSVTRFTGGYLVIGDNGSCVLVKKAAYC